MKKYKGLTIKNISIFLIFSLLLANIAYSANNSLKVLISNNNVKECLDKDKDEYGIDNLDLCKTNQVDCDDTNNLINAASQEICGNDIDENCDNINEVCITNNEISNEAVINIKEEVPESFTNSEKTYFYGYNDKVEISFEDSEVYYWFQDHLKNTRLVLDKFGNLVSKKEYYPFGKEFSTEGNFNPSKKFVSKELDSNGLHYFDARYYNSNNGRFTTVDPNYNPKESPYVYSSNNPINFRDLDGKEKTKGDNIPTYTSTSPSSLYQQFNGPNGGIPAFSGPFALLRLGTAIHNYVRGDILAHEEYEIAANKVWNNYWKQYGIRENGPVLSETLSVEQRGYGDPYPIPVTVNDIERAEVLNKIQTSNGMYQFERYAKVEVNSKTGEVSMFGEVVDNEVANHYYETKDRIENADEEKERLLADADKSRMGSKESKNSVAQPDNTYTNIR